MKVNLIKQSDGNWKPLHEEDQNTLRKFPVMHKIQVDVKDSPRSIDEHRMAFAFINFLFENQNFTEKKEKFRASILLTMGYTDISFRRLGKGKYEEIEIPMSLSFSKMTQKKFHAFFKDLIIFAKDVLGTDFKEWRKVYWKDEGSCVNPDCHNKATEVHEIFPGSYRRQACIDRGWQVKICRDCHNLSHNKAKSFKDHEMDLTGLKMLRIWLKVLNLNEENARSEIMRAEKNAKEEEGYESPFI